MDAWEVKWYNLGGGKKRKEGRKKEAY